MIYNFLYFLRMDYWSRRAMRSKISSLCAEKGKKILFVTGGIAFPAFAHAEGMPQLEFGNWLVQAQVLWGAVVFVIFMLALRYTVMPGLEKMLKEREDRIEGDLAYAKNAQREAETLQSEIEAELQASRLETQKIMQKMADEHRQKLKLQEEELRRQMDAKMNSAVQEMSASVKKTREDLPEIVVPVSEFIVGRCLANNSQESDVAEKQEERKLFMFQQARKYLA
ncbi:ATP synthase F0 subunit B [Acetobacteraceae bacterium]|nr:ATP synthase F0 subunit B [Acetobacteraceae bacterium]